MPVLTVPALTRRYTEAQGRISAEAGLLVYDAWQETFRAQDIEGSSVAWLAAVGPGLRVQRRRSRELTGAYMRLLRAFSTGSTLPPLDGAESGPEVTIGALADDFADAADEPRTEYDNGRVTVTVDDAHWPEADEESADRRATVSLMVTGPVRVRREIQRLEERRRLDDPGFVEELERISDEAGQGAAAAAEREARMGGRDLVSGIVDVDQKVIGWARVPDDDPCHFCAMLASRGAVYRSEESARRANLNRRDKETLDQFHTGCQCEIVPIYSRADWIPPQSKKYQRDWYRVTKDAKNAAEARAMWRRYYEQRRARSSN